MKRKILLYSSVMTALSLVLMTSCKDVLDKKNLTAIQANDIWNNLSLAKAYVDGFYSALMPGMPTQAASFSDDAGGINYLGTFDNPYGYGTATVNSANVWNYSVIRDINILLEQIDAGTLSDSEKDKLKGQALFWRAWAYWQMVETYGGVPLILKVEKREDGLDSLQVKRSKTSVCVSQIIGDLNQSFELLPDKWGGSDVGRIDRCAAIAFKARVLLYYASPQFNPTDIKVVGRTLMMQLKQLRTFVKLKERDYMRIALEFGQRS